MKQFRKQKKVFVVILDKAKKPPNLKSHYRGHKIAQRVRRLAAKPEGPNSIPRPDTVNSRNQLSQAVP